MSKVEQKLKELGVELKELGPCNHPILRTKQAGDLLFVSGHGTNVLGKVGADLTVEEGYQAAREAAVNCLSAIKGQIGDLDCVVDFLKVFGMVNSAPDFVEQPAVMNGVSDLLIAAFGEKVGSHARSAVGMASLPRGIATEVEMIVRVKMPKEA